MLTIKYLGFSIIDDKISSRILHKSDKHCHNIICVIRYFFSKIKIKNFNKLVLFIINFIKTETVYLKRKFDSKQPKFFLKPQKNNSNNKNSVSFFLKNVSDYKDSLKNKDL
ncbi:MAG: hypothetical protein WC827_04380 [Candidatus Paceibacterota bacterium]|jgi:hypothetical protein